VRAAWIITLLTFTRHEDWTLHRLDRLAHMPRLAWAQAATAVNTFVEFALNNEPLRLGKTSAGPMARLFDHYFYLTEHQRITLSLILPPFYILSRQLGRFSPICGVNVQKTNFFDFNMLW
jgi:hypothetical protein